MANVSPCLIQTSRRLSTLWTWPSGIQPWYWFGKAGYAYSYAGENLAKDFDTSAGAAVAWFRQHLHDA
jgi:hypothetical protein